MNIKKCDWCKREAIECSGGVLLKADHYDICLDCIARVGKAHKSEEAIAELPMDFLTFGVSSAPTTNYYTMDLEGKIVPAYPQTEE